METLIHTHGLTSTVVTRQSDGRKGFVYAVIRYEVQSLVMVYGMSVEWEVM